MLTLKQYVNDAIYKHNNVTLSGNGNDTFVVCEYSFTTKNKSNESNKSTDDGSFNHANLFCFCTSRYCK